MPEENLSKNPLKILLVEDDVTVQELLFEIFIQEGYEVIKAQEGTTALKLLEEVDNFDVVMTDLGLPGASGWKIAKKAKEKYAQIIVIIISGWGATLKKDNLGIDYALPKPFEVEETQTLFHQIEKKLQEKKLGLAKQ
jgi:DNA-binding response OmpR family regulator